MKSKAKVILWSILCVFTSVSCSRTYLPMEKDLLNDEDYPPGDIDTNYYKLELTNNIPFPIYVMEPAEIWAQVVNYGPDTPLRDPEQVDFMITREGKDFSDDNDSIGYIGYTGKSGDIYEFEKSMRTPGKWTVRAVARFNFNGEYSYLVSNPIPLTVMYPDISQISGHPSVVSALNSAWSQTKADASPTGRNEGYGWIFIRTETAPDNILVFDVEGSTAGPVVQCGTTASSLFSPPSDTFPENPLEGGTFAVAYYHTHTPLTYCCSGNPRATGPSSQDSLYAVKYPEIVVDYEGQNVYPCDPIDDFFTFYQYGPQRRQFP